MWNPDEEMEQYLKEFRPRAIRRLAIEAPSPHYWPRRVAGAAAILLVAGLSIWLSRRGTVMVPEAAREQQTQVSAMFGENRMNPFLMTRLALEDKRAFDAMLTENSRRVLPSLQGQESMLRVLASDGGTSHDR
jgi:hypothetical protein